MATDYYHLVEIYRKHSNGLDHVHSSIQFDYSYYCGPGRKTPEEKAGEHATLIAEEFLDNDRAQPGNYMCMVYRVPSDSRIPVPKDNRKHVVTVGVTWPPRQSQTKTGHAQQAAG